MKTIIICKLCEEMVGTNDPSARYCSTCKAIMEYEHKQANDSPTTQDRPKSPLSKLLADIEQYNKDNNAHLSYGRYVNLKERGLI